MVLVCTINLHARAAIRAENSTGDRTHKGVKAVTYHIGSVIKKATKIHN